MKEIWSNFANNVKSKWKETVGILNKLLCDSFEDLKYIVLDFLTMIENFIINLINSLWTPLSSLVTVVLCDLLTAIIKSVEYLFNKVLSIFKK